MIKLEMITLGGGRMCAVLIILERARGRQIRFDRYC